MSSELATNAGKIDCHGLPVLLTTKHTHEKVLWAFTLGAFCVLLGYGIFVTASEFNENPMVTSTNYLSLRGITFPTVYICPAEKIDQRKMDPLTRERLDNFTRRQDVISNTSVTVNRAVSDYNTDDDATFMSSGVGFLACSWFH